jgi:thiol-disulfide isomerase/thioredoxin
MDMRASIGIGLLSLFAWLGPQDATLTLQDLTNRPDLWPANVKLARDFEFQSGVKASAGQAVTVLEFDGREVLVDAGNGLVFGLAPGECDLLAAANAAWSALTPAQRAVDAKVLLSDASLWPERVTCSAEFGLDDGTRIAPGTEYELLGYDAEGVKLYSRPHQTKLLADLAQTDLVARARQRVLLEPAQRPSRIAAALKGQLVDAEGKPFTSTAIEDANLYALYFSASWCAPCRKFSPKLIELVKRVGKDNPRLATVLLSNDKERADMLAYLKDEEMPWPAMPLETLQKTPVLLGLAGGSIPHLVILDRHGLVLASSVENGRYIGVDKPFQVLTQLIAAGRGK